LRWGQFLALFLHQAALALRPFRARVLDPGRQRGCRHIQLARVGPDRLVFVEDEADGAFLELLRELPANAPGHWTSLPCGTSITFRRTSTKADQSHDAFRGAEVGPGSVFQHRALRDSTG
jgi:hypothetical protein